MALTVLLYEAQNEYALNYNHIHKKKSTRGHCGNRVHEQIAGPLKVQDSHGWLSKTMVPIGIIGYI